MADQLQCVLDGQMLLDDVIGTTANAGEPLESCFHGLQHYLMDEDIRAKDPEYREMQESEMRKLISLLRTGADATRLAKVCFLRRSNV